MTITVKCPQCHKSVTWDDRAHWRPFCSERCKLIDLGDWAEGNHKIADQTTAENNLDALDDFSEYH